MEFKNLAEVELLGEVPEGASVLAATADGDVVRVPGDGLGGGGNAGGGGQFIVNIELSGNGNYSEIESFWETEYYTDGGGAVCDKSLDEIKSAYESGLIPVAILRQRIEDSNEVYIYTSELIDVYLNSEDPVNSNFLFGGVYGYIDHLGFSEVSIYPDSCNVCLAGRSL